MSPDLKKRQINVRNSEHIPRPANCFMIFRADWLRNSIANATQMNCVRQKQKDVSLEAAAAWNSLSPTLRQLYKIQAEIIKEEHTKKYPGWVYQPRAMKRRSTVVDGIPPDDSSTKRVARSRTVAPYQKPSVNVKGKRKTNATPFAPITAPTELVWDGSWFSGSSLMKDPFYSAPLQPLASVSPSIWKFMVQRWLISSRTPLRLLHQWYHPIPSFSPLRLRCMVLAWYRTSIPCHPCTTIMVVSVTWTDTDITHQLRRATCSASRASAHYHRRPSKLSPRLVIARQPTRQTPRGIRLPPLAHPWERFRHQSQK